MPDTSCSQQWTITAMLSLPDLPTTAAILPLLAVAPSDPGTATSGQPGLLLRVTQGTGAKKAASFLVATWAGDERQLNVTRVAPPGGKAASLHVALVRDGDRLGVWLNGVGGWVLENVHCVPARQEISYCHAGSSTGSSFSLGAVRVGQTAEAATAGEAALSGASLRQLRVYNYAIPRDDLGPEAGCQLTGSCGSLLLDGWQVPDAVAEAPGQVTRTGAALDAASTPLPLSMQGYYLLVGAHVASACDC